MPDDKPYPRFAEVLKYAAEKHNGQYRKGTDIPYIVHPIAVASTLARHKCSEPIVYAALLHDTVEDANVTPAEIASLFGNEVAHLVLAVSETKLDSQGNKIEWDIRKEEQLRHLADADISVVKLKAADVMHNLEAITCDLHFVGEELWTRFNASKARQVQYYQKLAETLIEKLGSHRLGLELQTTLDRFIKAC